MKISPYIANGLLLTGPLTINYRFSRLACELDSHNPICTVFENPQKCRIWVFQIWHFPPFFILLKVTCLVTLFDRKLQVFQKIAKINHFRHFQWTFVHSKCKCSSKYKMRLFFCDFQTPCQSIYLLCRNDAVLQKQSRK